MAQLVHCRKLGKELPGLDFVPFDDALGERLQREVSAQAWQMWLEHSKMLINEYRLDLITQQAFDFLHRRCEEFFFGEGSELPKEFVAPEHKH
ncbi:MAG TPA: oxidative damage protection protein [Pseudomonadota bacterium]|jgi:Fe-S cluster biosynthesis and repair protein YggX|nr:oxidative damage protection protein [Pseudomonadota bacterium]HND09849.1 oxidative damage protection protein [Pseudomonadota bacterium]HNF97981.1 oxidative damage protection protein [Pseudomonadota bacterium]HNI58695.1 oxidative damage protection protein [Pseudomonadota bacterium]HNK43410.1 oxidative damage protection protein [Pseudomonadota bacterium]